MPLQYLNSATNFFITSDNRIELALLRLLGDIDCIFFERLASILCVRVINLSPAANVFDRFFDRTTNRAGILQGLTGVRTT